MEEDFKVSERPIEQVKDILTGACRYGKRGKYTLKDINVEQETAEVTNGHEKKLAGLGNCNHCCVWSSSARCNPNYLCGKNNIG